MAKYYIIEGKLGNSWFFRGKVETIREVTSLINGSPAKVNTLLTQNPLKPRYTLSGWNPGWNYITAKDGKEYRIQIDE